MIKLNDTLCENTIETSGNVRYLLWKNHFYNENKLSDLITLLKQSPIGNYLSSYYIDPEYKFIELRLRQNYIDKNMNNIQFYNNDSIYGIIHDWYKSYYGEIVSLLSTQNFSHGTPMDTNMYYYVAKYDNSIILNFI